MNREEGQLWAVEVPCPCCREMLLCAVVSEGMTQPTGDFPPIRSDSRGYFMRCESCGRRVSIDLMEGAPGTPVKVRVADRQDCSPLAGD